MRNWLGQDVVPGSVVYRGARDGNTSTYKIGVVESVNDDKGTARVEWKFENGYAYRQSKTTRFGDRLQGIPMAINSKGSPAVESLIVLDQVMLDRCEAVIELVEDWKKDDMPTPAFKLMLRGLDL